MVKLSENSRINSRLNSRPNYRLNNHRGQEFFEKCWALSTTWARRNKVFELFCMPLINRLCKDKFSSSLKKYFSTEKGPNTTEIVLMTTAKTPWAAANWSTLMYFIMTSSWGTKSHDLTEPMTIIFKFPIRIFSRDKW